MTEPSSQPQPVSSKPCLISLRPEEIRAREGFYKAAAGKQFLDQLFQQPLPSSAGTRHGLGLIHLLWDLLDGAELSNHV